MHDSFYACLQEKQQKNGFENRKYLITKFFHETMIDRIAKQSFKGKKHLECQILNVFFFFCNK